MRNGKFVVFELDLHFFEVFNGTELFIDDNFNLGICFKKFIFLRF